MTDLPFMQMNWERFFTDAKVEMLSPEARGIYLQLLGKMWLNQGWISADDRIISRKLDLDIRRWRATYKPLVEPLLRREIDPHVGAIYTQKHLTEVRASAVDLRARYQTRTAAARAAKAAKSKQRRSVTEPNSSPVTTSATEPATEPDAGNKPETINSISNRDRVERRSAPLRTREEKSPAQERRPNGGRWSLYDQISRSLEQVEQQEADDAQHTIDHDPDEHRQRQLEAQADNPEGDGGQPADAPER